MTIDRCAVKFVIIFTMIWIVDRVFSFFFVFFFSYCICYCHSFEYINRSLRFTYFNSIFLCSSLSLVPLFFPSQIQFILHTQWYAKHPILHVLERKIITIFHFFWFMKSITKFNALECCMWKKGVSDSCFSLQMKMVSCAEIRIGCRSTSLALFKWKKHLN